MIKFACLKMKTIFQAATTNDEDEVSGEENEGEEDDNLEVKFIIFILFLEKLNLYFYFKEKDDEQE